MEDKATNQASPTDQRDVMQRAANDSLWSGGERVGAYATRILRPAEVTILVRHRDALTGRVLELGCGAGRLTGYLAETAASVHAIDLSLEMIAYCRARYPNATYEQADLRDLNAFADGSFDAVVAGYNVIDVLGDGARSVLLDEILRLLGSGGFLIMSSHNRAIASRLGDPLRLRGRPPRQAIRNLIALPRRLRRRRRLRSFEQNEPGYAILNDAAHDFSALHYYITRDMQETQLEAHGFELLECLDLDGRTVAHGEVSHSPELHYIARRVG